MTTLLGWTALEYEHRHRPSDWFWSVGIVAFGGAVLAVLFHNLLFAIVIIVGAIALVLHALRHPNEIGVEIQDRGILINNSLYPYQTLESFWIHEHQEPHMLVLTSQKLFMPHIHAALAHDVDPEHVRDILLDYLPEKEVPPSLSEKIMDELGF